MAILRHQIQLSWPGGGGPGVNTWHQEIDASLAEPQAVIDTLKNFYTEISGFYPGGTTIRHLGTVTDVDTDEEQGGLVGWTVTSASPTSRLPAAAMMCLSWRSTLRARRGMGRTFIGPLTDAVDDGDGTPANDFVAALTTAGQNLITASQSHVNQEMGVYGLVDPIPKGTVPTGLEPRTLRPFMACTVNDKYAILRSRRD